MNYIYIEKTKNQMISLNKWIFREKILTILLLLITNAYILNDFKKIKNN